MEHPKRATINEIAALAGVSKGAASFALNGRPGVSEATRAKVLAIAKELQWTPNRAARALGESRAGVIGFVLNRSARILGTETYFPQLLSGVQLGLTGTHTALQMMVVGSIEEEQQTYRQWWQSRIVDGVIVVDPRMEDPRLELLDHLRLPAVQLGSHSSPISAVPAIWADDLEATRVIVEYLRRLGHHSIAHIAGPAELEHTALRQVQFTESGLLRGIHKAQSIASGYEADAARATTRELLSQPSPPTALVYDTDVMAVAGMREAQKLGFSIPDDLSIVSFEDSLMAELGNPPVTALTRDTVDYGLLAAKTLMEFISTGYPPQDVKGRPPVLTVRRSTGRPPRP